MAGQELEIAKEVAKEITRDVYNDGLRESVKTVGNGLNMCLKFIGAKFSPMMYEYIQNAEYQKKEIDRKLQEKYETIPENKRVEPRLSIMGPSVDLLKYNLDQEYIKNFFVNIMCSEMNSEKQQNVLPSYVEIVKQLSKKDCQFLTKIYNLYKDKNSRTLPLDIIRAISKDNKSAYIELDKYLVNHASMDDNIVKLSTIMLDPITIDNLSRLEIIKIRVNTYIPNINDYDISFNSIKHNYEKIGQYDITNVKSIFEITEFGLNFLNICFE